MDMTANDTFMCNEFVLLLCSWSLSAKCFSNVDSGAGGKQL